MNTRVTALIAVKTRELRDALQALLESTTHFHTVYQTFDAQTSIACLKTYHPALMLCDYDIFTEIGGQTNTQFVVLVDNRMELNYVVAKGISNVVITGTPVDHLITIIDSLLNHRAGSANDD